MIYCYHLAGCEESEAPNSKFLFVGIRPVAQAQYFGGMYYAAKVAEIKDLSGGYGLESQSRMKSQTTSSLCFFAHPFELKTPWAPTPGASNANACSPG